MYDVKFESLDYWTPYKICDHMHALCVFVCVCSLQQLKHQIGLIIELYKNYKNRFNQV